MIKTYLYNSDNFDLNQIENFKKQINEPNIKSKERIIGHYFIKKELSKQLKKPISEIEFKYNAHNKPYIDNAFYFNISHSGKYIILAISNLPIGVDIESFKKINPKLINRIATKEDIESFDNRNYDLEFLKLWTLKEAYFKFIGTGITNLKAVTKNQIYSRCNVLTTINENFVLTIIKGR